MWMNVKVYEGIRKCTIRRYTKVYNTKVYESVQYESIWRHTMRRYMNVYKHNWTTILRWGLKVRIENCWRSCKEWKVFHYYIRIYFLFVYVLYLKVVNGSYVVHAYNLVTIRAECRTCCVFLSCWDSQLNTFSCINESVKANAF